MPTWRAVEGLDEEELERQLYPSQTNTQLKGRRPRPEPDWSEVRAELARRDHHVTLALLWQEYKAQHPRWVPVFPVLRSVPALREKALGGAASGAPRWGEDVR